MQKTTTSSENYHSGLTGAHGSGGGIGRQYRSLTQIIVELLRERIFSGEYEQGQRLNIADLAQKLEVSPVPVREALRNLETEGLVQFHPNRGVMVRELSGDEVRELFLIRFRLEALAGSEAARWATAEDIAALEELLGQMDRIDDTREWEGVHCAFHERFYQISRLPRLNHLVATLRGQMRPYSQLYLRDAGHIVEAQAEHHALVKALGRRDSAEIERIIREHLIRPARIAMAAMGGDADHAVDFEPAAE